MLSAYDSSSMAMLSTDAQSGTPLVAHDRGVTAALRQVLETHGFAGDAVLSAFGIPIGATQSHVRLDLPVYLKRLASSSPLHTLIKLFVLDQWVDEEAARSAVTPLSIADLRDIGLVETGAHGVRADGCFATLPRKATPTLLRNAVISLPHAHDGDETRIAEHIDRGLFGDGPGLDQVIDQFQGLIGEHGLSPVFLFFHHTWDNRFL
jgi:hypothetical protein